LEIGEDGGNKLAINKFWLEDIMTQEMTRTEVVVLLATVIMIEITCFSLFTH